MPSVSIIIRTYNEEDWIKHCLEAVFSQQLKSNNYEVIIVDNCSTDKTVDIAKTFPVSNIVKIKKYLPGKAINKGIKASHGEHIVFLSAHCIPKNNTWLHNLTDNLIDNEVAGVYGRQIPTTYSSGNDVRDLYITFGLDKRIQVKDYFFHNANSAIKKTIWDKIPFDESLTNIEDRAWAKTVINSGYKLVYEPKAEVFHSHGIHQNQRPDRTKSTIEILKHIEDFKDDEFLPSTMKPDKINVTAFIPIRTSMNIFNGLDPIKSLIDYLDPIKELNDIIFLSTEKIMDTYISADRHKLLKRPKRLLNKNVSLADILKWGLDQINSNNNFPDFILYINPEYVFRPDNLVQTMIYDACYKGLDSVFVGFEEYLNYWVYDDNENDYKSFGVDLSPREKKHPYFRGLYGLGCLTKSKTIRKGLLVGEKNIAVIPTDDIKYTLRTTNKKMLPIIEKLIKTTYQ